MKAIVLSLILATGLSVSAQADFTIVQKVETKGGSSEITIKLKGDRIRMEATPQMTMIVDGKTSDTITLMTAQKKFIRISGETTKAIAEMAAKYGGGTVEKPKFTATGKKMTINGYEAEEYIGETSTFKATYWIAPKFPDAAALLKQLQAVTPTAWSDLAKGMLDYRDLPGFPLRTQVTTGEEEITSTITAVKQEPLSDADFLVPKDFQEMKMPNVKELSRDQPTAPPPSRP